MSTSDIYAVVLLSTLELQFLFSFKYFVEFKALHVSFNPFNAFAHLSSN